MAERPGVFLASSPSDGYLSPQYRAPAARRPRSIFDDSGDMRWREDYETLTAAERAHYERVRNMSAADIFKILTDRR